MGNEIATRPATRSASSREWLATARAELEATTGAADVLAQFARLSAAYGDGRIADQAARQMLLREWLEAFGAHSPRHLHQAVGALIQTVKFWPTIAEVLAEVRSLRKSLLDDVQRQAQIRLPCPQKDDFARHGRSEAEEIAFRAAVCLAARRKYGYRGLEGEAAPAPAADAGPYVVSVSDVSQALLAARRKRGLSA